MIKKISGRMNKYSANCNQLKKYGKVLFLALVSLVLFTSCQKSTEKDPSNNQFDSKNTENVSLNNTGEEKQNGKANDETNKSTGQNIENDSKEVEQKDNETKNNTQITTEAEDIINPGGQTIAERFQVLKGYKREKTEAGTFAHFLQNLPLKPEGTKVKYYDGRTKNKKVYLAVADYPLGNRDLQQCADVVIRLRAEYLYENNRQDEIHFNFVSGFNAEFSKWSSGKGISVNGNTVSWTTNRNNNDSYESFQKYLDMVYAYASTLSLEKELVQKPFEEIAIGDVFIQAGSPGHCVIVVDMAINKTTGDKILMLAQGYMPAQDIQILIGDEENSPWFSANIEEELITPEWVFETTDLKTWE